MSERRTIRTYGGKERVVVKRWLVCAFKSEHEDEDAVRLIEVATRPEYAETKRDEVLLWGGWKGAFVVEAWCDNDTYE